MSKFSTPGLLKRRAATGVSLGLALLLAQNVRGEDVSGTADPLPVAANPSAVPAAAEVRFTDGSQLKLSLTAQELELVSPYGPLTIPVAEICRIEFATRTPNEVARKIDAAVQRLSAKDSRDRDAATAELLALRERAYAALLLAAESKDPEVARRAAGLLQKLRDTVPAEDLLPRPYDVLYTAHSRIAGTLKGDALAARTTQFGEVRMQLADLRSLRTGPVTPKTEAAPLPDPGNLINMGGRVGQTFVIRITGRLDGTIYGTQTYTTDSALATAAVHAGLLQPGQTDLLRVTLVIPPPAFQSSTQNGITSQAWQAYPSAFQLRRLSDNGNDAC